MIKTADAIRVARSLRGTLYSELDCINFIKAIIRRSPGGDPKYTDAHVPELWASQYKTGKYRHLVSARTNIDNLQPGMLVFKGQPLGRDHEPSHVGLYIGNGEVIHSSSAKGGVVITDVNNGQWTLSADHILIQVGGSSSPDVDPEPGTGEVLYKGEVVTLEGGNTVRLRTGPSTKDSIITSIPTGTRVDVMVELDGWDFIRVTDSLSGYMCSTYIKRLEPEPEPEPEYLEDVTLVSEQGSYIHLTGRWRRAED